MSSRYNVMCWTEGYNHCEHQEQRRGEDVRSQAVAAMDRQSDGLLNRRPMQLELPGSSMQGRVNLSLHRRRGAAVPGVPRCAGGGGGGAALRPSPVPWLHAAPAGALPGACIAPPRHLLPAGHNCVILGSQVVLPALPYRPETIWGTNFSASFPRCTHVFTTSARTPTSSYENRQELVHSYQEFNL